MRPLIIKDKYICKDKIVSFKDFTLEDNYLIKEVDEGFNVEGKIVVRGFIDYGNNFEEINKDIDVNILIPYDKLESRNMIKLVIDKVDFDKNENILLIKIKIKVVGEEELTEKLLIDKSRKMEFPPEEDKIDTDFIKTMEELMTKNQEVEVISTLEEPNDIFEVRVEENEPLPILQEEVKEEVEVETPYEKEPLIKSEYVTAFFFYRVKDKETIEDILNKFNMSMDDFKKLNNKTSVNLNDLIQIKINEK